MVRFVFSFLFILSQNTDTLKYWHDKDRTIRYHAKENDFVIANGKDVMIGLMNLKLQRN